MKEAGENIMTEKMRFKISVDTEIPFMEMIIISTYLARRGWRLTLADNGNIICEKEQEPDSNA